MRATWQLAGRRDADDVDDAWSQAPSATRRSIRPKPQESRLHEQEQGQRHCDSQPRSANFGQTRAGFGETGQGHRGPVLSLLSR